jgi:hypothetical protein
MNRTRPWQAAGHRAVGGLPSDRRQDGGLHHLRLVTVALRWRLRPLETAGSTSGGSTLGCYGQGVGLLSAKATAAASSDSKDARPSAENVARSRGSRIGRSFQVRADPGRDGHRTRL